LAEDPFVFCTNDYFDQEKFEGSSCTSKFRLVAFNTENIVFLSLQNELP